MTEEPSGPGRNDREGQDGEKSGNRKEKTKNEVTNRRPNLTRFVFLIELVRRPWREYERGRLRSFYSGEDCGGWPKPCWDTAFIFSAFPDWPAGSCFRSVSG